MNGVKRRLAFWAAAAGLFLAASFFPSVRAETPDTRPYVRPPATAVTLPSTPGDHKLKFTTHINGKTVSLSYLLHLPAGYADAGKKLPMLVFFHGLGEVGTDLNAVYSIGPMTIFRAGNRSENREMRQTCPFILLCPQCPPRGEKWNDDFIYKATVELIDQVIHNTRTDPDRVYATGLSMGGLGTWCVAEEAPDLFAAVAPLSAMEWHPESVGDRLKDVAVWTVTGQNDEPRFVDGNRHMEKALAGRALDDRFTYLINEGHWAFSYAFASPQFYEWFLSHRRGAMPRETSSTTQPVMPTAPGHYLLNFDTKVGDQPYRLEYVLYIPKAKTPEPTSRPAILFLHEKDTIGPDYDGICMHGPDLALERDPALAADFPFVVISPRLPLKCEWDSPGMGKMLGELLDHVGKSVALDANRISIAGIDAGANGASRVVEALPKRFAAITWVFAKPGMSPNGNYRQLVSTMPGRLFLASNEPILTQRLTEELAAAKRDWKITTLAAGVKPLGDDLTVFRDRTFLAWLAQQRLGTK
jgi:predicted peptidase